MTQVLDAPPRTAYRTFVPRVARVVPLSPTFRRLTLTGPDLARFADNGRDQRIKLLLPGPTGYADLPTGPDWYLRWREQPQELRNPCRTYTVRRVRSDRCEIDVDLVVHGDTGPASRWIASARPGDELAVVGPDARWQGDHGGVEWAPPASASTLLLAGDETAVPAVAAILESLPADAVGHAVLEVPHPEDAFGLQAPPGMRVSWLPRRGREPGALLVPAVRAVADDLRPRTEAAATTGPDLDDDPDAILWDVPSPLDDSGSGCPSYAWLAGEAGAITTLRRHLVRDVGVPRSCVAFMGYWRRGRSAAA